MKKAGSFYNKQEPDVNKESDIQPDIGSYSVRKEGTLKYKEGKKMEKDGRRSEEHTSELQSPS